MSDAWLEELPYAQCVELLPARAVGRIAVIVDGGPVVVPVNYRLVEAHGVAPGAWIALRTRSGNVIDQAADGIALRSTPSTPSTKKAGQSWYEERCIKSILTPPTSATVSIRNPGSTTSVMSGCSSNPSPSAAAPPRRRN